MWLCVLAWKGFVLQIASAGSAAVDIGPCPSACGGAKIDGMNIFPLEMSWRCGSVCGDNNVRIQRQLLAEGEVDVAQSISNFFLSKTSYFSDLQTQ